MEDNNLNNNEHEFNDNSQEDSSELNFNTMESMTDEERIEYLTQQLNEAQERRQSQSNESVSSDEQYPTHSIFGGDFSSNVDDYDSTQPIFVGGSLNNTTDSNSTNSLTSILNNVSHRYSSGASNNSNSNLNCVKNDFTHGFKDSYKEFNLMSTDINYFDNFTSNIDTDREVYFSTVESTIEGALIKLQSKDVVGDIIKKGLQSKLTDTYIQDFIYESGDTYMFFNQGLLHILFKNEDGVLLTDVDNFKNNFTHISVFLDKNTYKVYFIYTNEKKYDVIDVSKFKPQEFNLNNNNTTVMY